MRKTLLYIIGIATAMLTSCSDEVVQQADYLNGRNKTPLSVSALLDKSSNSQTRAANKDFDNGDQLIAYLRHVTWDGSTGARTSVAADHAPLLVTFTKGSTAMTAYDGIDIIPIGTGVALGLTSSNTKHTTDLTTSPLLYWDDFSNSATDATDLRTAGHYLQSYYGYCYNGSPAYGETGSHISTALNEADGTLGWTVATDQSTGFKTSDLLWSYEQTPVAYNHETTRAGLILPYTHAMSKVTIEVVCGEGFSSDEANFTGASVVLQKMNTVASLTAPTGTSVAVPGDGNANMKDITMQPIANTNMRQFFAALIAPTTMKEGLVLAKINNVDGNNYTLTLTDAVLNTADANDWASKLTGYDAATGGTTQPGVNYMITVTINKQEMTVQATIKDWEDVSAEGFGVIEFSNDIKTIEGTTGSAFKESFDAYTQTGSAAYALASAVEWDDEHSTWTYAPTIYWPNGSDTFKFRALSPANSTTTLTSGTEVLWGTTAAHKGVEADGKTKHDYDEGAPINPRTGDVPLVFYHPMSKITIDLQNQYTDGDVPDGVTPTDYDDPRNPLLDLASATIQISNMTLSGTIALEDGAITPTGAPGNLFSDTRYAANDDDDTTPQVENYIVIPQTITDDAIVTITLDNGTTYKLQLNTCKVQTGTDPETSAPIYEDITTWQRGKHYVYTITLGKEEITFRALIKDWVKTTGSGNATLEWD